MMLPADCPAKLYCMLSGGKDSMSTAHCLAQGGRLAGAVFIDTGISTPDILPFVEKTCASFDWPLTVVRTPYAYDDLVVKYGFPGPAMHPLFMNLHKGRAIRQFRRDHPGVILASGVRSAESSRRFRNTKPWSDFEGLRVFAPIFRWTNEQVWAYVADHHLPRSPAYETMHISGDCLCGAFSTRDEVHWLRTVYPEVAARLTALEVRIAPLHQGRRARWGWGPGFNAKYARLEDFICGSCGPGGGTL